MATRTKRGVTNLPTLNSAQTLPGNLPPASHDQDIFCRGWVSLVSLFRSARVGWLRHCRTSFLG